LAGIRNKRGVSGTVPPGGGIEQAIGVMKHESRMPKE
jgi:hypothetical protein